LIILLPNVDELSDGVLLDWQIEVIRIAKEGVDDDRNE